MGTLGNLSALSFSWRFRMTPPMIVELLHVNATLPRRATAQSAGYDLEARVFGLRSVTVYAPSNYEHQRTVEQVTPLKQGFSLYPGERAMVPLGFRATLPDGYEAQIRPRSGMSLKTGVSLVNSPGTVDADFPNEWHILLENRSEAVAKILEGQAIAQMVLAKFEVLELVEGNVVQTTDRTGGYGSTDGAPKQVTISAELAVVESPVTVPDAAASEPTPEPAEASTAE